MDKRTGQIRELLVGEEPREHEVVLTNRQARRLLKVPVGTRAAMLANPGGVAKLLHDKRQARKRQRKARRGNR